MIKFASLTAALLASAAHAQVTPPGTQPPVVTPPTATPTQRTTVYEAAFFETFAPSTALDIVRRVPGFSLEEGDADVRGFAGAAGNVVINGVRPSSKAATLETTLARIPANSVLRVEVGPGDLFGAEYSGKSQVINVILSGVGGTSGNVTLSARRVYTGRITPNAAGSVIIQRGASTINLAVASERNYIADAGTDELSNFVTGDLRESRRKFIIYHDNDTYVSGSWAIEHAADKAIRLNARWEPSIYEVEQDVRVVPVSGAPRDERLLQYNDEPSYEIGGDITRPLAGGAIKLVALATHAKKDNFSASQRYDGLLSEDAELIGGFEQTQQAQFDERIGRISWSHQDLAGLSFEAGAEAVVNTLDSNVELFVLNPAGGRTRIDLPIDNAIVKETRGEAFVNVGRSISPALRVDAGLNYEYSRLKVRGDAIADRTLRFLKPNATIDWKPGGDWHTQLTVRRNVAQLDFYDFISAAELSNDRVNAGNENLLPQRTWEFRLTVDRPILEEGIVRLDAGHDLVSLLQDRVLVFDDEGEGFDAPGNIGTGKRYFAKLTLDAPLVKLWSGLRVKFTGQIQRTRVEDPISGELRNFSGGFRDWEWSLDVRRDAGAFSYGLEVADGDEFTFFRTDEFDSSFNGGPFGEAFVEYRADARTAIALEVDNLFNTGSKRERLIFSPNRAVPQSSFREFRERNRHLNFGLTLKRSFGGVTAGS
ncbi:outer membrane beta-barrel protein [Altererythrobacter aurantiacus]|uniref:Outer membrane beta-barrel protein n=1 Tax=Parapontixanthobacter aurantiacus TaxID=1463599 RepID=A0A844ZGL2_9SPHN|nr:outer membrane beta-barrel protein [Parapontixanthobacter aurantiacus]MXO86513.1 outer membrane beta-barrel protein [Parapontixanthobacter aurantiacus]